MIGDVEKMSKSKKNTVAPEEIFDVYGVDAARLFVLSDSPPERDTQWTTAGVAGRLAVRQPRLGGVRQPAAASRRPARRRRRGRTALRRATHKLIKQVTEAIESFRFNSGIARLYEFLNLLKANPADGASPALLAARQEALSAFARLIAPFTPHLAEECWARIGGEGMVVEAPWPEFDPALTEDAVRSCRCR